MHARTRPILAASLLAALAGCCTASHRVSQAKPTGKVPLTSGRIAEIEDARTLDSPELRAALASGKPALRVRAARAMGRIQSPSYAAPLAAASGGEAPREVRVAGLFALGELGLAEGARPAEAAVAAARGALADPDPAIVGAAVEALGKLAPDGAAADLVPLVKSPEARVRAEVATALFRLRFVPVWRKQEEKPPPLPASAVAALTSLFTDPVAEVRVAAAHALSRFGEATAVLEIGRLVRDDDELVRLFAVRAIGRSGDERGAVFALQALRDASDRVQTEAVLALVALKSADRIPFRERPQGSFHYRAAIAKALGDATSPENLSDLVDLESDESWTVRSAAIEAFAKRLGPSAGPTLERHLTDLDWRGRAAAARSLHVLAADQALPLVERAFGDPDVRVQVAALEGLGEHKELATASAILERALASPDLAVRGTAVSLLEESKREDRAQLLARVYAASSGVEWIEIREAAVDALGKAGAASEVLARIAREDAAPSVRSRASTVLTGRGEPLPAAEEPPEAPAVRWHFLDVHFAQDPVVVLETSKGTIEIRCLASEAPIHVASFVERVKQGLYDGLLWHRVVPNFVIQGGDPRGDGWGGPGYTLRDEVNQVRFTRGTVGMPKAGKDTGGCQIFITHVPTPHLDGNYTVFGQVVRGLDVVDRIEVGDRIVSAKVKE